jgi:hypothetical protein
LCVCFLYHYLFIFVFSYLSDAHRLYIRICISLILLRLLVYRKRNPQKSLHNSTHFLVCFSHLHTKPTYVLISLLWLYFNYVLVIFLILGLLIFYWSIITNSNFFLFVNVVLLNSTLVFIYICLILDMKSNDEIRSLIFDL